MNGKIYKLQCEDGYFYIGSTTSSLPFRLGGHKTKAKKHPERRVYKHILDLGWDKVRIVLIEEFVCTNRQELYKKEDEHIRTTIDEMCLNHYRVERTREERLAYQKEQYEKHKDSKTEEQKNKAKEYKAVWFQNLDEEKKERRRAYAKNYYASLTEEQKKERMETNKKTPEQIKATNEKRKEYKAEWMREKRRKQKEIS
jgi:hypothetical protein